MPGSSWRSSWSSSGTSSTMERCVIGVSHILYTTLCPITLAVRGLCGHTCVRLCVYSTWWLMQGKSRWVKTTSVRCNVCEVIIYSLWTKLPSNLTLFATGRPLFSLAKRSHAEKQERKKNENVCGEKKTFLQKETGAKRCFPMWPVKPVFLFIYSNVWTLTQLLVRSHGMVPFMCTYWFYLGQWLDNSSNNNQFCLRRQEGGRPGLSNPA